MKPDQTWFYHEGHRTVNCFCLEVVDMKNRVVSHFSPAMYGREVYGPHLRVKMKDLK
ncbi:hypothetical protein BI084_gp94 [Gordonia phage Terapin]|uniref:Uncharacterized protein n=4 Tax=Terapinvirus terapin TaxID=2734283 RepID=A0A345MBD3_9CAUD|nr:hypothetical protein BI084_gp94 [Gordonia phage Terapin]AVP43370.1 hypothetical protein PBI_DJOKOVIC_93 [Gordonia phage Djokovic]AXH67804.1 hypothetical protein SEA_BEYONCAGE_93 [Gordonia phage Beyoncage]QOC56663.1 hypothetical protein SEA_BITESIZE_93 [Gordonia phage BiteSize]QYW00895.1 hypothetical protein SEA_MADI_92 [Gordonia phage Madi]AOE44906.1 hypothetical protein SEA_TERAPIN_94 [Gordonia phage Terapin]